MQRSSVLATILIALTFGLGFGTGCAASKPRRFLIPENLLTYEQGEALVIQGERAVADGEAKVQEGRDLRKRADRLIDEGRDQRKEGEFIAARGHKAIRAARMLEEAEALRQKGIELKGEALLKD